MNYIISDDGRSITCRRCGMTSHHSEDVHQHYCGYCHIFHDDEGARSHQGNRFRVRFAVAGGHVHCRFFAAPAQGLTFAKLGDFTVRRGAEFIDLLAAMPTVEFLDESGTSDCGIAAACAEPS